MTEIRRSSRLFHYGALEPRDELDERLEKCHTDLSALMTNLKENEVYNHLNEKVSRSAQDHEETSMALLFSILTDPTTAPKLYHTLTLLTRDSLALVLASSERIIMEHMSKLQNTTRMQVLWLTRELVQTGVAGTDRLCFALLKQLSTGYSSSSDIYLVESFLNILLDNREWMEAQPPLVCSAVYTYLSLLPGHIGPSLASLRDQETHLCVSLIRNKFMDCIQIGRDLVRLLQGVAKIPEFAQLWRDLLQNPQSFSPQFTGLQQILSKRTSRRFIAGRIVPDAEVKLNFLLSKVKFGQHKLYQEWFQKKYLSTPESHHQIPELIRYVCCVIHPPNEVLGSDIFPRWALIGWLLSLCQPNPVASASAKLALLFDWLCYKPELDSIMNIEPGILLMFHSLRPHPQITATLLDCLCRLIPNYCLGLGEFIASGVRAAFRDILHKEVLLSLEPLFDSPKLDDDLKLLIKKTFPDLTQPEPIPPGPPPQHQHPPPPHPHPLTHPPPSLPPAQARGSEVQGAVDTSGGVRTEQREANEETPMIISSDEELEGEDAEVTSAFSDTEEGGESRASTELESGSFPADSQGFVAIEDEESRGSSGSGGGSCDLWSRVEELPKGLKKRMLGMREESDPEEQTKLLNEFLQLLEAVCSQDVGSSPLLPVVAPLLADHLSEEFSSGCASTGDTETGDCERHSQVHCVFRQASSGSVISPLPAMMHQHQLRVGYFYIHYLHCSTSGDSQGPQLSRYKDFAGNLELDLKSCLLRDLKECVENEPEVFYAMLPAICREFSKELLASDELLSLIVAHIDPIQLHVLVQKLMMKDFQLFGRQAQSIQQAVVNSLQWDSFEQFCLWQLLSAEGPDCHLVIPALASLSTEEHPEAISSALLFLKTESSISAGIGALLSLPVQQCGAIVDTIASRWINGRPQKYAKLLSQYLEVVHKKGSKENVLAILEVMFEHLERLMKYLSSKQVFEAADLILAKTIQKEFSNHADLASRFQELHTVVSTLLEPPKKEATGSHSKKVNPGDKSSKSEPKAKKRRILNMAELTES